MVTRVSQRLNEAGTPVYYPKAELVAALNEAQRYFVLLTLGLENSISWTPEATFTHMLSVASDWICPLRITDSTGAKVRPATLAELAALNPSWISSDTAITRYLSLGADFIGVYGQSFAALTVTYVQAPAALVDDTDVPAIPAEYHAALVSYAIYRCRMVEGAQEFSKTIPYHDRFMDAAKQYAGFVRSRNKGARYDKCPPEDEFFDRSKLAGTMPVNLLPQGDGTVTPQ
jgi:hypothetical protein